MAEPSQSGDKRCSQYQMMMSGRLLEKQHFELAAKGAFRLGRC